MHSNETKERGGLMFQNWQKKRKGDFFHLQNAGRTLFDIHVLCWQTEPVVYKSAVVTKCIALVIASGAVACKAVFETTFTVLMKLQDSET